MFYGQLLRVQVNAVAQMVKLNVDVCRQLNSMKYHGIHEFCNYKLPLEIDLFSVPVLHLHPIKKFFF